MDTATLIGLVSLAVAIIGLLITIIEKWHVISPRIQVLYQACFTISQTGFNLSRRRFFRLSLLALASATVAYTLKFFDISSLIKKGRWSRYSEEGRFVVNKTNGTIHLKGICDDHLPLLQTTVEYASASHLHGAKKHQITIAVLENLTEELKEELLIDSIKQSPTSTHMYNYLIKQWGRTKQYSKIHEFLSVNIKYLESTLATNDSVKMKKKYIKAINELHIKKNRAEYLASISTFS